MYKKEESYNTEITDILKDKYQDILTEIGEKTKVEFMNLISTKLS